MQEQSANQRNLLWLLVLNGWLLFWGESDDFTFDALIDGLAGGKDVYGGFDWAAGEQVQGGVEDNRSDQHIGGASTQHL